MPVQILPPRSLMFQALLERMLTKDPAQRLPDCGTLLAALSRSSSRMWMPRRFAGPCLCRNCQTIP